MISQVKIFKGPKPVDGRKPDRVIPSSKLKIRDDGPKARQAALKKRGGTWVHRTCWVCGATRHIPKGAPTTCHDCTPK